MTFVYGQYGKNFKVMKADQVIDYDGENYLIDEDIITSSELDEVKSFYVRFVVLHIFYRG